MIIPWDLMKKDNMIKAMSIISFIGFLLIISTIPVYTASQCKYGSVHAWFQASDGKWQNATAHPILKRGEPFIIKINVSTTIDLSVFFLKLHEFGTPVYEVVDGPIAVEQLLECWMPNRSDQPFTYLWMMQVREDTTWVNGYAPLELFVQFNTNDTDKNRINFDVITAFIVDELWENTTQENIHNYYSSQGRYDIKVPTMNVISTGVVVFLLILYLRTRQQKHSTKNTSAIGNLLKRRKRN
jgi:sarcinarray family protein